MCDVFFPGVIFVQAAEKGRTGVAGFLTPFSIGIFGWVLALMTEQPWLLFYSCGYLASLAQGVCHTLSGEDGTLAKLHNIRDEYAHTTYFPALVIQSPVNFLQNTISDRMHCIAQLRLGSSFLLSVLRFLDRMYQTAAAERKASGVKSGEKKKA